MPLRPEQLAGALSRRLVPLYLVAGDDPVRVAEACAQVRAAARAAGHAEREVHTPGSGFDWQGFGLGLATASLFAARRLVELDIGEGRIGAQGEATLRAWLARPAPDVVLLVRGGAFDRTVRTSRWVSACEADGVFVYVWALAPGELPGWVQARARSRGVALESDAAALLAEWSQGNLAVAAQAIEHLALTAPAGARLDAQAVRAAADDGARYDVRDLIEATLAGEPVRALRVLARLREEGIEPPLVVWSLASAARALAGGMPPPGARSLQAAAQHALRRGGPAHWRDALLHAARADRLAKGAARGGPWDALAALAAYMAGTTLPVPGRVALPGET